MNKASKIVAVLLVLLAVLLGVYAFMLARRPPPAPARPAPMAVQPAGDQFDVVVAQAALPGGAPIDAAALKVVRMPVDPQGAYSDPSKLAGKIPRFDIGPGTPVTESSLVQGLTLMLEQGQRAVAVTVDEVVGAGNRVTPGDFVDVFFMLKEGHDVDKTQSRLLLSRLKVLTYGAASVDGNPPAEKAVAGQSSQNNANRQAARTAVLAVPTADVNRLLLAMQNGKLQLVLRHPTDPGVPNVALFPEAPPVLQAKATLTPAQREELKQADNLAFAGTELRGLAGDGRIAPPAPPRRAPPPRPRAPAPKAQVEQNTVEVVRGTKSETVGF
ncbi:Flp pilus assembly protein CpaB [Pigmentiphaga soli]|uniref:Flp pilus assembly protein CpaB n=1 Tax=Pigmentiphaga soli TaxID=1007095 RepID=A0ABP8H547_9BURK